MQRKKADLLKEIEKAKKKDPLASSLDQLKNLLQPKTVKPAEIKEPLPNKKRKTNDLNDFLIPGPVNHEYFDKTINKYFQNEQPRVKNNRASDWNTSGNILLENIYRMFGITAFPVRKPNSKSKKPNLLGIRIEIFNEIDLIFETPHYLILEKNKKTLKWDIFKHTIPNFIQIQEIAIGKYDNLSDFYLFEFIKEIRDILNKLSLKYQLIKRIKLNLSKNVKNLENDLSLEVIKFDLKIPNEIMTPVILNLSLDRVESSFIERGFSETEKIRINNVLKGDIKTFETRLNNVIYSISNQ